MVVQALNTQRAALSLGCCGARAYLDALSDGVALWALPAAKLERYASSIATLAKANDVLGQFHRLRRIDVEAGARPTYEQSMMRPQGDTAKPGRPSFPRRLCCCIAAR